ncbi:hypothetical protein J3R30DRAFT_3279606 [Lentinula aciculospora]|uniref:AN1-type domain-containing protein n=1 Tax=Lentinula aciculospora TaxID=153920 RepID=A0A9W9ASK1_9AGAR|nr:hypothetical protein J3R30DRAFT_3279606 [Lentinula aciculospora]
MSELLNVGNRCFMCSQIDFLSTSCPSCHNKFCKDHIQATAHSCLAAHHNDSALESFTKLQRCASNGCKNPSLNASSTLSGMPTCATCQGSFCAKHREPASHNCSSKGGAAEPVRNEAARALLAKNFTSSKSVVKRRTPAYPTDPAKLAQFRKFELMKLRQRASPLDPRNQKSEMPVDKRRFFKANLDGKPSQDLWIEKVWRTQFSKVVTIYAILFAFLYQSVTAGKVFDLLVAHLGISVGVGTIIIKRCALSNIKNFHQQDYQLFKVFNKAQHPELLLYEHPLAAQVEDGGELVLLDKV